MIHAGVDNAPFGGVGKAGYSYYHGEYGFRAFSHLRTVVGLPTWMDSLMSFRYPPYNLKNLGKLGIPSRPPFRRGETLEDQQERSNFLSGWVGKAIMVSAVLVAATLMWFDLRTPFSTVRWSRSFRLFLWIYRCPWIVRINHPVNIHMQQTTFLD